MLGVSPGTVNVIVPAVTPFDDTPFEYALPVPAPWAVLIQNGWPGVVIKNLYVTPRVSERIGLSMLLMVYAEKPLLTMVNASSENVTVCVLVGVELEVINVVVINVPPAVVLGTVLAMLTQGFDAEADCALFVVTYPSWHEQAKFHEEASVAPLMPVHNECGPQTEAHCPKLQELPLPHAYDEGGDVGEKSDATTAMGFACISNDPRLLFMANIPDGSDVIRFPSANSVDILVRLSKIPAGRLVMALKQRFRNVISRQLSKT